ncbi:MAG: Ig-like domain-containing protein, partial [Candidatus Bathyarchaeia archaeon]
NVHDVSVTVGPPTRNIDLKLSPLPSELSGMISGIVEGESNPLLSRQPSAISCKTSATTVDLGSSITISGSISPVRVGVVVTISCSNDSAWVSLGTATSGLDGTYTYTWTPKSSGIYQLMASWEGDSTYAGAVSDAVSITVRSITTSPSPSSSTPTSKSGCLIATATYGSELSPQVQFLRIFRDRYVLQTFAGSSFMAVFNAVYYSFSPHIAALIYKSELLGWVMRILLYPLIAILLASYTVFELLSVSPELAVVTAGITASFLIGVVYLTPVTLLLFRLRRFRPLKNHILVSVIIWAISILATLISEVAGMSGLMMASTVSLVLATISVATLCTAKTLSRLPKTLTATLRFLR